MDQSLIRVLSFALLIPLSNWGSQWLFERVCRSAATSPDRVLAQRRAVHSHLHPHRWVLGWLIGHSPEPSKTRRLLFLYQLCTVSPVLCLNLSIFSFFTFVLDRFLGYAGIAVAAVTAVTTAVNLFFTARSETLREEGGRRRAIASEVGKFALTLSLLGLMVWLPLQAAKLPTRPASSAQVQEALLAQGYTPVPLDSNYLAERPQIEDAVLSTCNGLRFEFYLFDGKATAAAFFERARTAFSDAAESDSAREEQRTEGGSFARYTVRANGEYAVALYSWNTAVYAHCDIAEEENLRQILHQIGYL
ncbi:hypothetical protein KQI11_12445 [Acetanaerobacterium sp. MSJ-12]|uniref:hypothetical protein n=1 Tax=Acetanaerobacterium sp. MSJ-12 TaxID=2841535 RepID=UPI001C0ED03C|nr:hypothetical protein [Acetanaerobacterium sp. MSJ-12]MBU5420926.1 hypothetical protein [Acetanaerobacterium sp. MSJ-12]